MLLKIGFIIFISSAAIARDVSVNQRHLSYNFHSTQSELNIEGPGFNLGLKRNACNTRIVNEYLNELEVKLKNRHGKIVNSMTISIDSKKETIDENSSLGVTLEMLPASFQKLMIQDQFLCTKK